MRTKYQLMMTIVVIMAAQETPASFAQETIQLAPFTSIALGDGAHAVLRPAATHRVTLVKGSTEYSRVVVTEAGELAIEKCKRKCPKGYELEIEVFAPYVTRISLANSGRIQSREGFPRQGELTVAVEHGGTIDVRSIVADRVTAFVNQGGGIFTVPRAWLFASVNQGGSVTYWGDPQVKSSIEHGGAVTRGRPGELNAPR